MGLFIQKKQLSQLLPLLADTLETTISTYLTIPEIYIIVAHLADTKMTRLEVAITAGIYLVVYIFIVSYTDNDNSYLWQTVTLMTYDKYNAFCRALPASTYIVQWGNSHVWKVGGKVFAIGGWAKDNNPAFTFKVSELNFQVLSHQPGFRPAPYMAARGIKWIQQYNNADNADETLKYYLSESYRIVSLGLTKKKQKELGLNQINL